MSAAAASMVGPRCGARRAPRGVAMLLVLITLTVGTVLAAAALSSRDNSSAIGINAGVVTGASWAAEAGANVGQAVLESSLAWRARGDGVILEDFPLAGARVNAVVTDLQGNPPSVDDREVILLATASIDQLDHTVERRISLGLPASIFQPVDPFLSEFALFADEELEIEPGAKVRSFRLSPEADTRVPIKFGLGFDSASGLNVSDDARLRGVERVTDGGASSALGGAVDAVGPASGSSQVGVNVPAYPINLPGGFPGLPEIDDRDLSIRAGSSESSNWGSNQSTIFSEEEPESTGLIGAGMGGGFALYHAPQLVAGAALAAPPNWLQLFFEFLQEKGGEPWTWQEFNEWVEQRLNPPENAEYVSYTLPAEGRYARIEIENAGELTIDAANGTRYQIEELLVDTDGVVRIIGKVELYIEGDLELTQGATIELANSDSALYAFVGDDVLISNSAVGLPRTIGRNIARRVADITSYSSPARCRIMMLSEWSGGGANPRIRIRDQSLVLACLHGPHADLELENHSALIGQAVAGEIKIDDSSEFYYDPTLDSRAGYSSRSGPAYEGGAPLDSIVAGLNTVGETQGAFAAAAEVVGAMRLRWADSANWEILDASDPQAGNVSTYDGYKQYDRSLIGDTWDDTTEALDSAVTSLTDPLLAPLTDPQATSGGATAAQLEQEDLVLPTAGTSRTPTARVDGRVTSGPGNRAARELERDRGQ